MAIAAYQVWTSVGTLIGTIVDNFTAKIMGRACYMIPLAIIYVVPAILTIGLFFIPESPRWLAGNGQTEKCRRALIWLRGTEAEAEVEFKEIQLAIQEEQEMAKGITMMDMFRDPVDRRRTMLSVAAVSTQAASGVMYMLGKLLYLIYLRTLALLTFYHSLRHLLLRNGQSWERLRELLHPCRSRCHRRPRGSFRCCTVRSPSRVLDHRSHRLRFLSTHPSNRVHEESRYRADRQSGCRTLHHLRRFLQCEITLLQ